MNVTTERDSADLERGSLEEISADAVRLARAGGVTDSECTIAQGEEFSVSVRHGEVENVKKAGSRAAGIRVLIGKRSGSAYTSDLTLEGIQAMVRGAIEIAGVTTDDPFAGLPDDSAFGQLETDLELYFDDVESLDTEEKIRRARDAEAAALAVDPRINNSDGASFDTFTGVRVFSNSRGFVSSYRTSNCSLSAVPVAREGSSMERDYWMTVARSSKRLESPEYVGRKAAERVLRRLGARKVPTQRAPVIFESRIARSLLDHLFEAVNGGAIYRNASFLAGKLGQKIASEHVTVVDDGTIPGLFGSSPSDDEGIPSRRTMVVDKGVLTSYLLNTYSARRLGLKSTGSATRGLTGAPGVGHGNLYLEPGTASPEEMIRGIRSGLYVTELIGHGVNTVTGDYSRGAVGLWIENGELSYPVSEITIASTLPEMLAGIEMVASDLEFRGSLASPAVLVREMTISGN
jgi:PmbA protein